MAANLRTVIFGVQPVLPAVRQDLGLSFVVTGALTSVALAVLGLGSIPGAIVGSWLGARRAVAVMSAGIGAAALGRVLPVQPAAIFVGTVLVSLFVSFVQPSATVLLRQWFSNHLARASGIYSNGLLVGGTVGSVVTPFLASAVGWRGSFAVWGGLAVAVAVAWAVLTPRRDGPVARLHVGAALRNVRAWEVTALFTFQNLAYFGAAAWLPFLLTGRSPAYIGWVFVCLNVLPIVPLLLLPGLRWPFATSPAFYLAHGVLTAAGAAGLLLGLRDAAWLFAFMIGLGCAATFVAAMALPPMLARTDTEAAGITAVVFTFGYLFALWSPLGAGWLVDATGSVPAAFLPSVAGGVLMAAVGLLVPRALASGGANTA